MKTKKQLIIITLIILGGGLLLSLLFHGYNTETTTPVQPTPEPVHTVFYTDPENYFSLYIPSDWTKKLSTATNTTGTNTDHPVIQDVSITQFYVPNEKAITIQVYKGQPVCQYLPPVNAVLATLPASYNEVQHQWIIPTTNATIIVTIAYPGSGGFGQPLQTVQPTTLPKSVVDADRNLVEAVLVSIKLNNAKPYQCD
jgi:hypothetical protein